MNTVGRGSTPWFTTEERQARDSTPRGLSGKKMKGGRVVT